MHPTEVLLDVLCALPRDTLDAIQISFCFARCMVEQRLSTVCLRAITEARCWAARKFCRERHQYVHSGQYLAKFVADYDDSRQFESLQAESVIERTLACLKSSYVKTLEIPSMTFETPIVLMLLSGLRAIGPTLAIGVMDLNVSLPVSLLPECITQSIDSFRTALVASMMLCFPFH